MAVEVPLVVGLTVEDLDVTRVAVVAAEVGFDEDVVVVDWHLVYTNA